MAKEPDWLLKYATPVDESRAEPEWIAKYATPDDAQAEGVSPEPPAQTAPERGPLTTAQDRLLGIGAGTLDTVRGIVNLANTAGTDGQPRSEFAEAFADKAGEYAQRAREAQSAREQQLQRGLSQAASGTGILDSAKGAAGYLIENPAAIGGILDSLPGSLAIGGAPGAIAKGLGVTGRALTGINIAGQSGVAGTMSGQQAADAVMRAKPEELGPVYQAALERFGNDADARRYLAAQAMESAAGTGTTLNAVLLGAGQKLGLNVVENALIGRGGGATGIARGAITGAARETIGEAPQGAADQFAQNIGQRAGGLQTALSEGVGGAAVLEGVAGAPAGALAGGMQGAVSPQTDQSFAAIAPQLTTVGGLIVTPNGTNLGRNESQARQAWARATPEERVAWMTPAQDAQPAAQPAAESDPVANIWRSTRGPEGKPLANPALAELVSGYAADTTPQAAVDAIDTIPDAELQRVSPAYAALRRTLPETRVKMLLKADAQDVADTLYGPAAQQAANPADPDAAREQELSGLIQAAQVPEVKQTLQGELKAIQERRKQRATAEEFERLASQTQDPELRQSLIGKAQKIRQKTEPKTEPKVPGIEVGEAMPQDVTLEDGRPLPNEEAPTTEGIEVGELTDEAQGVPTKGIKAREVRPSEDITLKTPDALEYKPEPRVVTPEGTVMTAAEREALGRPARGFVPDQETQSDVQPAPVAGSGRAEPSDLPIRGMADSAGDVPAGTLEQVRGGNAPAPAAGVEPAVPVRAGEPERTGALTADDAAGRLADAFGTKVKTQQGKRQKASAATQGAETAPDRPVAQAPGGKIEISESAENRKIREDRGYTEIVTVDARALLDAIAESGAQAGTVPGRLEALRKVNGPLDDYPRLGMSDGRPSIQDGRNRLALAAERGQSIDVAMLPEQAAAARAARWSAGQPAQAPSATSASAQDAAKAEEGVDFALPDNAFYSALTRTSASTPAEHRAELERKFGKGVSKLIDSGLLNLVQSYRDLPAHIRTAVERAGPSEAPKALYFRGDGKNPPQVFVIADNVSASDAPGIVLHEIGEHYGLEAMLGNEAYAKLLDDVSRASMLDQLVQKAVDTVLRNYGHLPAVQAANKAAEGKTGAARRRAIREALSGPESRQVWREVIAHVGESADATKRSWFRELLNKVRAFLRSIGLVTLSGKDIQDMVVRSLRRVMSEAPVSVYPGDVEMAAAPSTDSQRQMEAVRAQHAEALRAHREDGKPLPAPNGKPSKLNEYQWVQVRTPAFKRWFGDWENDPANASKVVDENGEPLVVYHGTRAGTPVQVFEAGRSTVNSTTFGDIQTTRAGIFFSDNSQFSEQFGDVVQAVYLRIENPAEVTRDLQLDFADTLDPHAERDVWLLAKNAQQPWQLFDGELGTRFVGFLKSKGYDGATFEEAVETNDTEYEGRTYVAFRPEQIKSAIGNRGTFDPAEPRIDFALGEEAKKRAVDAAADAQTPVKADLSDAQKAALSKIGVKPSPLTRAELEKRFENAGTKLAQGLVDQFAPLKELDEIAYMQARLSKGTDGNLEAVMMYGTPIWKDGALHVERDGKGFFGHMSELQGEHDMFLAWVAGNRAEKLMAEGRENLLTVNDIKALKALNQGKMPDGTSRATAYMKALAHLRRYQKAVLDVAEQAGMIDPDGRAVWENDFYVPFYRVLQDGNTRLHMGPGGLARQQAIKQLKGGDSPLNDLMANTIGNWSHLLSASMRNTAAVKALKAAERAGIAERITPFKKGMGRDSEGDVASTKGAIWVMEGGKKVYYRVDDPLVVDALTALDYTGIQGSVMDAMRTFKRMLTIGVTASPTFRVRNLLRDTMSAIGVSDEAGWNPIVNIVHGWEAAKSGSDTDVALLAGGGKIRFGIFNDGDAKHAKRLIERGIPDQDILDTPEKVKNFFRWSWDWWQSVGDRAETVNRAIIYENAIKAGKTHLEASFLARDLLDFSMSGKWTAVRFLTQTVPFMNARMQGLYKLGRAAKANPIRFAAITGMVALASALLYAMQADDDEYRELPDWVRNTYWPVKIGNKFVYIPKPFEFGALGSIVERGTEWAMGGNDYRARDFRMTVAHIIANELNMNPVPQAIKPIMEVVFNYNMFLDRPIDSPWAKTSPRYQYGPTTSAGARFVGDVINVSPQKIEHLVRGYFGWLGVQALNASDWMFRGAAGYPSNPKHDLSKIDNWFVVGDFVKDAGTGSSKYVERFYDMQKDIVRALADAEESGDRPEIPPSFRDYTSRAQGTPLRRIQDINAEMRRIGDSDMSAREKRERIDDLKRRRNEIARTADERARAVSAGR